MELMKHPDANVKFKALMAVQRYEIFLSLRLYVVISLLIVKGLSHIHGHDDWVEWRGCHKVVILLLARNGTSRDSRPRAIKYGAC